jgi:hypothetical protein
MKRGWKLLLGMTMALLCAAALGVAKSDQVNIIYETRVGNGPTLKPGVYKLAVINDPQSPKVQFYQNGKRVAEVPAKIVSQNKKNPETEVYYNTVGKDGHVLTEIRLNGWTENIMFPTQTEASNSSANSGSM